MISDLQEVKEQWKRKNKTLLSETGLAKLKISELSGLRNGIINQTAAVEMSGQDFDRSIM